MFGAGLILGLGLGCHACERRHHHDRCKRDCRRHDRHDGCSRYNECGYSCGCGCGSQNYSYRPRY